MTQAVKVMVRCRPMSTKQKQRGCHNVVQMDYNTNQVSISKLDSKQLPKSFSYDCVFGSQSLQSYIYEQTAFSLVDNVLQGYNGTIFAYGQTGCGKTHTMMGNSEIQQQKGIIPRTFHQIITLSNSMRQKKHLVQCSFIQIYNEQIHDLLGKDIKQKKQLKESPDKGVFVKDLSMIIVKTQAEMQKYMDIGFKNRAVRETAMNKESSRSHSLFTIHIESQEIDALGAQKFKVGKLNLVDLAGSERQSKTHATGDGMKQAAKINLSLSALGNVISALVDGKIQHIPYRDSKLTRLLQDSLGGNTKTIMIAAVSPADYNFDQTLSTLRYASRAKFIKNKPIINQDPKDTLLREYADEIKLLKQMLQGKVPLSSSQLMNHPSQKSISPQIIYKQVQGHSQQLQQQLTNKQRQLIQQQEQKTLLLQQMQKLQALISHQDVNVDKKEIEKMNRMKEKLKLQKKKEQQYQHEKKRKQQEMLHMETSYKSLNQQIEVMRNKFAKLKTKYIQNLNQMKDLQSQHQNQKQQLRDTIRMQQSEVNKYSSIIKMLLTNDQIQQILQQSSYNDQTHQWSIVPFYYRERTVNFPKLPMNQTKQLIQNQKQKKQIIFKQQRYNERDFTFKKQSQKSKRQDRQRTQYNQTINNQRSSYPSNSAVSKSKQSFRISDVVKNARQNKQYKKDKSQYNIKGSHDFQKYQKIDNSKNVMSHNQLTSLHNLSNTSGQPVKQVKNPQLTPIKTDSQQRIRLDQMNINSLTTNNNSANRMRLNPIDRKG